MIALGEQARSSSARLPQQARPRQLVESLLIGWQPSRTWSKVCSLAPFAPGALPSDPARWPLAAECLKQVQAEVLAQEQPWLGSAQQIVDRLEATAERAFPAAHRQALRYWAPAQESAEERVSVAPATCSPVRLENLPKAIARRAGEHQTAISPRAAVGQALKRAAHPLLSPVQAQAQVQGQRQAVRGGHSWVHVQSQEADRFEAEPMAWCWRLDRKASLCAVLQALARRVQEAPPP